MSRSTGLHPLKRLFEPNEAHLQADLHGNQFSRFPIQFFHIHRLFYMQFIISLSVLTQADTFGLKKSEKSY